MLRDSSIAKPSCCDIFLNVKKTSVVGLILMLETYSVATFSCCGMLSVLRKFCDLASSVARVLCCERMIYVEKIKCYVLYSHVEIQPALQKIHVAIYSF